MPDQKRRRWLPFAGLAMVVGLAVVLETLAQTNGLNSVHLAETVGGAVLTAVGVIGGVLVERNARLSSVAEGPAKPTPEREIALVYAQPDRPWAEWLAASLDVEGHRVAPCGPVLPEDPGDPVVTLVSSLLTDPLLVRG